MCLYVRSFPHTPPLGFFAKASDARGLSSGNIVTIRRVMTQRSIFIGFAVLMLIGSGAQAQTREEGLTAQELQIERNKPKPIENPIDNEVRPLSVKCQKWVMKLHTLCAPQPAPPACDRSIENFQKKCILPPETEAEKKKRLSKSKKKHKKSGG